MRMWFVYVLTLSYLCYMYYICIISLDSFISFTDTSIWKVLICMYFWKLFHYFCFAVTYKLLLAKAYLPLPFSLVPIFVFLFINMIFYHIVVNCIHSFKFFEYSHVNTEDIFIISKGKLPWTLITEIALLISVAVCLCGAVGTWAERTQCSHGT
jgi:hypothetical protein